MRFVFVAAALYCVGCGGTGPVECTSSTACDLHPQGVCTQAPSGRQWCAYGDGLATDCPSGLKWSEQAGDGLANTCVATTVDAGLPDAAMRDASIDAAGPTNVLTVTRIGSGSGTITSNPGGIDCGASCSAAFAHGASVTLTATKDVSSDFVGWSGACSGVGPCTVALDADKTATATFGVPGEILWVKQIGSPSFDTGTGVQLTPDGDIVAVGVFSEPITIDGLTLTPAGTMGWPDILVVKLSRLDGSLVWAKRFGGSDLDGALGVAADAVGDVYVTGQFTGTIDFDLTSLTSDGGFDIFAVKLSGVDGVPVWAKRFGGVSNNDTPTHIAVDNFGDAIIAGQFDGTASFDDVSLSSYLGTKDGFIIKIAGTDGHRIWARAVGGDAIDMASSVAADGVGDVVMTGSFAGQSIDLGDGFGHAYASHGLSDIFVVKYASVDGTVLWLHQYGDVSQDNGTGVAVDATNEIFITGNFDGMVDFGGGGVATSGNDFFIAKLTSAGAHIWSGSYDDTSGSSGESIASNPSGGVFATGTFFGTSDFGGGGLSSAGNADIFVASYASDAAFRWARRFGSSVVENADDGRSVAADTGIVAVTGDFLGFSDFGTLGLNSVGQADMFVAAVAP